MICIAGAVNLYSQQAELISKLYQEGNYNEAWCIHTSGGFTYIGGFSRISPDRWWVPNNLFVAKYNNSDLSLVAKKEYNLFVEAHPYSIKEESGKIYMCGVKIDDAWPWYGFILEFDINSLEKTNEYITPKEIFDFTFDDQGNIYTIGAYWGSWSTYTDILVRKLNSSYEEQKALVLRGDNKGYDYGWDIVLNNNKLYIAGYAGMGIDKGVEDLTLPEEPGNGDYFVAQCDLDLKVEKLVYVGGSGEEYYDGIQIGLNAGKIYFTGYTKSTDLPAKVNNKKGGSDAFVSKIDIASFTVEKSIYIGGTGDEQFAVGAFCTIENDQDYVYLTGYTNSTDFKGVQFPALQNEPAGKNDAFIAKVDTDLTEVSATYIGGTGNDCAYYMSTENSDQKSRLFISGYTDSPVFPDDISGGENLTSNLAGFTAKSNNDCFQRDGVSLFPQHEIEVCKNTDLLVIPEYTDEDYKYSWQINSENQTITSSTLLMTNIELESKVKLKLNYIFDCVVTDSVTVKIRPFPELDFHVGNGEILDLPPGFEYKINDGPWITCTEGTTGNVAYEPGQITIRETAQPNNVRHYNIEKGEKPSCEIDYIEEKSITSVLTTIEYNYDNDFSSPNLYGTEEKIELTPGKNIYFRTLSTKSHLPSDVFILKVPPRPAAPTLPVIDDKNDLFDWTYTPGFENISDYVYTLKGNQNPSEPIINPLKSGGPKPSLLIPGAYRISSKTSIIDWLPLLEKPLSVGNFYYEIGKVKVAVAPKNGTNGRFRGMMLSNITTFSKNNEFKSCFGNYGTIWNICIEKCYGYDTYDYSTGGLDTIQTMEGYLHDLKYEEDTLSGKLWVIDHYDNTNKKYLIMDLALGLGDEFVLVPELYGTTKTKATVTKIDTINDLKVITLDLLLEFAGVQYYLKFYEGFGPNSGLYIDSRNGKFYKSLLLCSDKIFESFKYFNQELNGVCFYPEDVKYKP